MRCNLCRMIFHLFMIVLTGGVWLIGLFLYWIFRCICPKKA